MTVRDERHRVFFALLPDDGVRSAAGRAAARLLSALQPGGKPIPAVQYHVTLRFLGEDSSLNHSLVERAMAAAARIDAVPFDLILDTAFSFPGARPPWVLGCRRPPESLRELWQALGSALAGEGVPVDPEGTFVPHLTVLRHAEHPLPACAIETIQWRVRDIALMHSQPGGERRYVELGRWPLPAG